MKTNYIIKAFLIFLFFVNGLHPHAQNSNYKLSEFVRNNTEYVIHGFGQGLYRWQTDAIPYFEAIEKKPVVYSSYLTLTDITLGELPRLEQFKFISEGWEDTVTLEKFKFIPIIGVGVAPFDFDLRQENLAQEFFNELGITQDVQEQYGIDEPTYQISIFTRFLQDPDLWQLVKDTLKTKGLELDHIDLNEIFNDGSDESIYKLITLRDSVVVLANENLIEQGFLFGDLEVLNGNFDSEILELADSIKATNSQVLVRFLYETITGLSRSYIFSRSTYQAAYKHFVDLIRSRGVNNIEFIFHSNNSNKLSLEEWYPGDEYVDWVATSIFNSIKNTEGLEKESQFAVDIGKPFMVVESSPTDGKFRPDNVFHPDVWNEWFVPYFNFIKNNKNTKLFVYIGIDWGGLVSNFSDWGNARVQENPELFSKYKKELNDEIYLHNKKFRELYNNATDVKDEVLPSKFELYQNYPNPFNPTTKIKFIIPFVEVQHAEPLHTRLEIFDILGRRIQTLVNRSLLPGTYEIEFDGSELSSGVYFYRLSYGALSVYRKMALIK